MRTTKPSHRRWRQAAVIVSLLVLSACGDDGSLTVNDDPSESPATAADGQSGGDEPGRATTSSGALDGVDWALISGSTVNGPLVTIPGWRVTLRFDGNSVGGTSACNGYGGGVSFGDDNALTVGGLGGTDMGCAPTVQMLEVAYLEALQIIDEYQVDGDRLVLAGESTTMEFTRLTPIETASMVGRLWLLDTIVIGDTATSTVGDPATLRLAPGGSLEGSTGCRKLRGEWTENGDEILFSTFAADGECLEIEPDDGRGLVWQDTQVVTVLGDGFQISLAGDRLTVTSTGEEGLQYQTITEDEFADLQAAVAPQKTLLELLAMTSWELVAADTADGALDPDGGPDPFAVSFGTTTMRGGANVTVIDGCNELIGLANPPKDEFRFGLLEGEEEGCGDNGPLLAALASTTEINPNGDQLIMVGVAAELVFRRLD